MQSDRKQGIKLALTAVFLFTALFSIFEPIIGVTAKSNQRMPDFLVFDKNRKEEKFSIFSGDYGEAPFDHQQHVAIDSCATCHHTNSRKLTAALEEEVPKCTSCHKVEDSVCTEDQITNGTDNAGKSTKGLNAVKFDEAYHGKDSQIGCIGCHRERSIDPKGCKDCHTGEDTIAYRYKQTGNTTIVQQNFTSVLVNAAPAVRSANAEEPAKCEIKEQSKTAGADESLKGEEAIIDEITPDADEEKPIKSENKKEVKTTSANNSFSGEWININANSNGMTRLVVSQNASGAVVEAWGKCRPKDCQWGKTDVKLYGEAANDRSSKYGLAVWDHGHSKNHMTLRFSGEQIEAEVFKEFKDGSGRSNYRYKETMQRADNLSLDLISEPFNTGYGYPGKPTDIICNGRKGFLGCSGQSFIAKHPIISSVDVLLMSIARINNKPLSPDTITMKIWSEDGRMLISRSKSVEAGFGGWLRFDIPQKGLKVEPGRKLIVTLQDTGKGVLGWMSTTDNYAYGAFIKNIENPQYDFVFRINSSVKPAASASR